MKRKTGKYDRYGDPDYDLEKGYRAVPEDERKQNRFKLLADKKANE